MTTVQEIDTSLPKQEIFVGRFDELSLLVSFLRQGKNIIIYGWEGVGKTSLAIEAVRQYTQILSLEGGKNKINRQPIYINLGIFVDESLNIFDFFEQNNLFTNALAIVLDEPSFNGLDEFPKAIKIENQLKEFLPEILDKAKMSKVPILITSDTRVPLTSRLLKRYHFETIDLEELTFEDFRNFAKLFNSNLSLEELLAIYEYTRGNFIGLKKFSVLFNSGNLFTLYFIEYLEEIIAQVDQIINSSMVPYLRERAIQVCYNLGVRYLQNKKYLQALFVLYKVKEMAKKYEVKTLFAQALLQLGHSYKSTLALNKSRLAYKDALRLFKQLGDEANIAEASASLAALEIYQGRTVDARKHLAQAKEYFEGQRKDKALDKMELLLEAADYVDDSLMLQGRLQEVG